LAATLAFASGRLWVNYSLESGTRGELWNGGGSNFEHCAGLWILADTCSALCRLERSKPHQRNRVALLNCRLDGVNQCVENTASRGLGDVRFGGKDFDERGAMSSERFILGVKSFRAREFTD